MQDSSAGNAVAVADTHVHLYGCFDWGRALDSLARGLGALAPGAARIGFLAEKAGVHALHELLDGRSRRIPDGLRVDPCADGSGAVLRGARGAPLYLVGGRQVATSERIEILVFGAQVDVPDGTPAESVVERAWEAGGIAVLSWAPGKWTLGRRRVVKRVLSAFGPDHLLLADTSLRAVGFPEPRLMRRARERGHAVLAGSDPLPFAGEECRIGTYASLLHGAFDAERPVSSACALLRQGEPRTVGCRSPLPVVLSRLIRNAMVRTS